ncbi:MAG TPA: flagellar motor stator protein MotA [Mariprofundaceae bacterium]|nr:flagellar motor stator protein MotA [Mariprofundaceae bacterium]
MLVIGGWIVVIAAVFGGYALAGGHLAALFQPTELLIIGGAATGAFIVGNNGKAIKATLASIPKVFSGSKHTKAMYMQLLALLYELLVKARKDGLMALEQDIDDPAKSPIFSKYPEIMTDHHVVEFIVDYLRLMVGGNMNAFEIESLMDHEIETHHKEAHVPIHVITKVGDAMPAFGIVAAVMGVAHTMEFISAPPAVLGEMVAKALVGTFLGILLGYGFISPIAGALEAKLQESSKVYDCVKVTLLATLNSCPPPVAIEFGRKVLYSTERPAFLELEENLKKLKSR